MCGIAGVVGDGSGAIINRMTAMLRHRGPDAMGVFSRGMANLGATRLSIVDPFAPAQPVHNAAGKISLVFNGEIYNYRELMTELRAAGHEFTTKTDTEVILHLYEEFGDECVRRLRGMFAIAILDENRLLLARDRFGIKPLFYATLPRHGGFAFASEVKAILQHPSISPQLDMQALGDSIALGHPVGDATFFEGIKSLLPGHTMVVSCAFPVEIGKPTPFRADEPRRDETMDLDEAQTQLGAALDRAVATHLAADVEVGMTLSGGLDSTVLALFAAEQRESPLVTFSVGDHDGYVDVVQAEATARMLGSEHHSVKLTYDEYLNAIPALVASEERPSSLHGISFLCLSTRISARLKACIHGEGADELFGGYPEYLNRDSRLAGIRQRLPRLKCIGVAPSPAALGRIEALNTAGSFSDYLARIFESNMGAALERQHLAPVDQSAMAVGLEMRVPYLADEVVDVVSRMPLRFLVRPDIAVRKYILRRLALTRFGPRAIDSVLRAKFAAPAAGLVLLNKFDRECNETLPDTYEANHELRGCFGSKRELLLFDMFVELFIKRRGAAGSIGSIQDFIRERAGSTQGGRLP